MSNYESAKVRTRRHTEDSGTFELLKEQRPRVLQTPRGIVAPFTGERDALPATTVAASDTLQDTTYIKAEADMHTHAQRSIP